MKIAKVKILQFDKEWQPSSGSVLYVYNITFDNGDKGHIYSKEKDPLYIMEGTTVNYSIDEKNKIKIIQQNQSKTFNPQTTTKKYNQGVTQFIGYAYGYAKDIIIAETKPNTEINEERLIMLSDMIFQAIKKTYNENS